MRVALWLVLAALPGALAASVEPAILNGKDTTSGEFPWIVSLRRAYDGTGDGGKYACAGVLVAPDVVLSVFDCINAAGTTWPKAWVGNWRTERCGGCAQRQVVATAWYAGYPNGDFSGFASNQGVLLKLDRPVTSIQPIAVPKPKPDPPVAIGTKLTVAGWGFTSRDGESNAPNLKKAILELQSKEQCKKMYPDPQMAKSFDSGRLICGLFPGHLKATCWNDGSAPFFLPGGLSGKGQDLLVGWQTLFLRCDPKLGGAFMSASRNSYWITEGIKVLHGQPSPNKAKYTIAVRKPLPPTSQCNWPGMACYTDPNGENNCCNGKCSDDPYLGYCQP